MSQTVVVTGGTAGIGRAIAQRFAEAGWNVGILARGEERLDEAQAQLTELGVRALCLHADVADPQAVDAAAERIEAELGPIDLWVNNAMATILAPVDKIAPDEYRRVTDVTYLGTVHGTLAALQRMKPRGRGHILQVGSVVTARPIPLQSAYCAAKSAAQAFTESLRAELLHDESPILLTQLHLPAVNTPQFEWSANRTGHAQAAPEPIYTPETIARAAFFAAEHPRRDIWIARTPLLGALGQAFNPSLIDRFMARAGWKGQQADEPPADDEGNLFEPKPGEADADGPFADKAKDSSFFFTDRHRNIAALGAVALAGIGALAVLCWVLKAVFGKR